MAAGEGGPRVDFGDICGTLSNGKRNLWRAWREYTNDAKRKLRVLYDGIIHVDSTLQLKLLKYHYFLYNNNIAIEC